MSDQYGENLNHRSLYSKGSSRQKWPPPIGPKYAEKCNKECWLWGGCPPDAPVGPCEACGNACAVCFDQLPSQGNNTFTAPGCWQAPAWGAAGAAACDKCT